MKTFTISAALALMATLTQAAPSLQSRQGPPEIDLTFEGAGPNPPSYTVLVPVDGSVFTINDPLSVSHISDPYTGFTCTVYGSEGSTTTIVGPQTVDVGPPQPQVSGVCTSS